MVREQYPWAQWAAGPRKGPAANRNNGVKYATGEWLAFTDDDCLPSADWLEAYLSAIPLGHLVYEGKTTCLEGLKSPLYEAPINLTGGSLWSCNLFIDRALFLRIKGFDEQFAFWMEDADFRTRLQKSNIPYCFVSGAAVNHPPRRRGNGQRISAGWEAHIQHWHKEKMPQPSCTKMLIHIIKARLRQMFCYSISLDTVKFFASMFIELWTVGRMYDIWQRKYSGLYSSYEHCVETS